MTIPEPVYTWQKKELPARISGLVNLLSQPLAVVFTDVYNGGVEITWEQFHMQNFDQIKINKSKLIFPNKKGYPEAFKDQLYFQKYGLRGHKQHNAVRLALDQSRISVTTVENKLQPVRFRYTFQTVEESSFKAWHYPVIEVQMIAAVAWYCEYVPKLQILENQVGIPLFIPDYVRHELYEREVIKAENQMRLTGFRVPSVYGQFQWYSSLYSYVHHSKYGALVRSMIRGVPLVVCDAIGVLGLDSSDLYPSPYAVRAVKQQSVADALKVWKDETLVICFGSTFLTNEDYDIINKQLAPVIFLDVVNVPFVGGSVYGDGLTARGINQIPFIRNDEKVRYADPVFTSNLLDKGKQPNLIYYICSDGAALQYLIRMVPNFFCHCTPDMYILLKSFGVNTRIDKYSTTLHFRIIEGFEQWRKYRTGYFVPAGRINPDIVTIRSPLQI